MSCFIDEFKQSSIKLNEKYCILKKNDFTQIIAIGEIVLSSLKIDNGEYGKVSVGVRAGHVSRVTCHVAQVQAEMGLPVECTSGDNNGTWWCAVINNEDSCEQRLYCSVTIVTIVLEVEENVMISKIVIAIFALITGVIGFIGVSYGN